MSVLADLLFSPFVVGGGVAILEYVKWSLPVGLHLLVTDEHLHE